KCTSAKKLLFATEYGGCAANGSGALNPAEMTKWWAYLDANRISSNAWAVETNPETSSVFVTTASPTGPWPDNQLTDWGKLVFPHVAAGYAITMAQ
ncbi:MAG TPA: hypothetical protein VJV79_33800, partial [Polyangiaceae bacterium]|nr:hypothetical protein [Polyangiaceae bacterium]